MFQHVSHTLVDKTDIYFSVKDDAVRTCFVQTFLDSIVLHFSCFMKVAIICFVLILVGQCLNTELYLSIYKICILRINPWHLPMLKVLLMPNTLAGIHISKYLPAPSFYSVIIKYLHYSMSCCYCQGLMLLSGSNSRNQLRIALVFIWNLIFQAQVLCKFLDIYYRSKICKVSLLLVHVVPLQTIQKHLVSQVLFSV